MILSDKWRDSTYNSNIITITYASKNQENYLKVFFSKSHLHIQMQIVMELLQIIFVFLHERLRIKMLIMGSISCVN